MRLEVLRQKLHESADGERVVRMESMMEKSESLDQKRKNRLDGAFSLQPVDRPPALGGWIADPGKILALTGAAEDEYWNDPIPISIEAYKNLELDGLLDVNVPSERGGYTLVTHKDLQERARCKSPEDFLAMVERLPSPQQVFEEFSEEEEYQAEVAKMEKMQRLCGKMYWCPARWELIPNFEWYRKYGYEPYLMAIAIDPDKVAKLYEYSAAVASCRVKLIARMVKEGRHPKAMLCGMDICGQRGPLVDPRFLRERYFPLVKSIIKPIRDVGAKLVWHCDGDVRAILDDILELGVGGLQGFQEECGVRLRDIVERRTIDGEQLIILGPISVTTTLVRETPEGVRAAVHRAIEICEGKASLVLMTSNEILPDVPLDNMIAMYEALREMEN